MDEPADGYAPEVAPEVAPEGPNVVSEGTLAKPAGKRRGRPPKARAPETPPAAGLARWRVALPDNPELEVTAHDEAGAVAAYFRERAIHSSDHKPTICRVP